MIDVDDIYFLIRLPCNGVDIYLYNDRWSAETTATYLVQHYFPGAKLNDRQIDIKTIERFPLRTIDLQLHNYVGV